MSEVGVSKFRSQMFVVGDLVEAKFNSTQEYGLGLVVDIDDSSMSPKVYVLWPNKNSVIGEYFQDISRVIYEEK